MRLAVAVGVMISPILVSASSTAFAQGGSTGLDDLVGARAGQAEGEIVRRGFRDTGGSQSDDLSYVNWWNAQTRQCVVVGTSDGRYVSVQATTPPDCKQPSSTRLRPNYGYQPPKPSNRPRPDYGYQPRPDTLPSRPGYGDGGYNGPSYRPGAGYDDIALVCSGRGSSDSEGRFRGSLNVQVSGGGGRIRLPNQLIPPLNSGGRDGWWELRDVSVGGSTIRATYKLNGINRPSVVIDRRSGSISIQGLSKYAFSGDCDPDDNGPRRF